MYRPDPVDTSRADLPPSLSQLTEQLAKNTHDLWAIQRIREGWKLGPQRDDEKKEHPGLVPYEDLPDSEREYDRITAIETVKLILALGYRITPPDRPESIGLDSVQPDESLLAILEMLMDAKGHDLTGVLNIWRSRRPEWEVIPEFFQLVAERLISLGEPLFAHDVLATGLERWPDNVRIRQLMALALARSGAAERAINMLEELISDGDEDVETLGLHARTLKDLWESEPNPDQKHTCLINAYNAYRVAYDDTDSYWVGINAATLGLIANRTPKARELAERVYRQAEADLKRVRQENGDEYWPLATLGEAALIRSYIRSAESWYRKAAEIGRHRYGDLHSTRRNAHMIADHLGCEKERIDDCFSIPPIRLYIGKRQVDQLLSNGDTGSLPSTTHEEMPDDDANTSDPMVHYVSLISAGAVHVIERYAERGDEVHVVVPYGLDEYLTDVGNYNTDIVKWMDDVLPAVTSVVPASHCRIPALVSADYTCSVAEGLARIRAQQLGTDVIPIRLEGEQHGLLPSLDQSAATDSSAFPIDMMAFLFADAVGFSRFTDEQIPHFVNEFFGTVCKVIDGDNYQIASQNTWGDGLHMVFPDMCQAARFALDLRDRVVQAQWASLGMPATFGVRIALHAGPAYRCDDPISGRSGYFGAHVSHAARIEPITPPGEVFGSLPFASLLAASGMKDIRCTYIGQTPWAKDYGTYPTFHLQRQ